MNRKQLITSYLEFFREKSHRIIKGASLIPENDPTILLVTAGMHPLVPYILGEPHPEGKRLANFQPCIRTGDIDSVGDDMHLTFFEMLGNWSLGDYWKKEAIAWSYEFLTKNLKFKPEQLHVTVFSGDNEIPRDKESAEVWQSIGIPKSRIYYLGREHNFWGPAGLTGPCGPCTEMFIDTGKKTCEKGKECKPGCDCGKYFEIWNDVFMEYGKDKRLILVDGMHCLYDKDFGLNKELLEIVENFNMHYILAVNKFRGKGYDLLKKHTNYDTNWQAFSLEEEGINKDSPEYFKTLLKRFNLIPEEVIYFDHDKKNVETAEKIGILSKQYTDTQSIKKFVEDNLYVFKPLKQRNVDTGMGVERAIAMMEGKKSIYETEIFLPIIKKIKSLAKLDKISGQQEISIRIIADHTRASAFILSEGVQPSNIERGYVLRRLIRKSVRHGKLLGIEKNFTKEIAKEVISVYSGDYLRLKDKEKFILDEMQKEESKFRETLENGLKKFEMLALDKKEILGVEAFLLFQSFGFPLEITVELAKERGIKVDSKGFDKELKKHQDLSRTASAGMFKSGLADSSEITTKYHTATHMLHQALRVVLGNHVQQKGSNITSERLRFDFSHDRKMTLEEIKKVEDLINEKIKKELPVSREEMSMQEAIKHGALAFFGERYGEKVSVYTVGKFSKEVCGGPHVKNTRELGEGGKKFKIVKEEAVAAGVRRIKAVLV